MQVLLSSPLFKLAVHLYKTWWATRRKLQLTIEQTAFNLCYNDTNGILHANVTDWGKTIINATGAQCQPYS
jgi:hypothetical protein